MLSARAFRIDKAVDKVVELFDYLTVRDYAKAKEAATKRIVKRQSRGSIFAQNGWYMTAQKLAKKSRAADADIEFLARSLKK